ncbi:helix-turn-helix domain-containing protein [Bombilactobacillus thymidiniphilus]|uniref:XRE family transcriptional regulator n=1 Tax=Bombilactobacillus thymidiniphilus TaxID=2923363 RepID=A0ABY4PCV1_9LACO|nr:XRE family transcriptional regulator [Bombilactobacillus thymidiniphilus]UQS83522.1 XRE family transcriptional regulator [Bombilactobacillus thymidiniphilus]
MNRNILGPVIRKLRIQKGLKQVNLSKLTGFNQNTISNHENQNRSLTEMDIRIYARALGVTPQDLFDICQYNTDVKTITPTMSYNYFATGISAGFPESVDPFTTEDTKRLQLPKEILGKYSDNPNIFFTRVNGESMNNVLENGSLIAILRVNNFSDLHNGDIVVFQDENDLAVKRFMNNVKQQTVTFSPDSSDAQFLPLSYHYNEVNNLRIIGKVVVNITSM